MISEINGKLFVGMITQGAQNLLNNADLVDSLNAYPAPDGDTGTNMNLTITSGCEEAENNLSQNIGELGRAFPKGLLVGARGSSGVTLSQLFKGFCKNTEEGKEISVQQFVESFQAGVEIAYKAVMKLVGGTILTVAKDAAKAAMDHVDRAEGCVDLMAHLTEAVSESLDSTPNLLTVFKEVGVADSGGKGLLCAYKGLSKGLEGERIEAQAPKLDTESFVDDDHDFHGVISTEDTVYGYCTETMVRFGKNKKAFDEQEFRNDMSKFGDSLLVINDGETVKVHVHTEHPDGVFDYGRKYGELIRLKAENMHEQHREVIRKEQDGLQNKEVNESKTVETITVTTSVGDGIAELFKSMGATHVISGGQTTNSFTENIVKAIEQSQCKRAIILPNNKNIMMASEQAISIVEAETVAILTKSTPQGISALSQYDLESSLRDNKHHMSDALETAQSDLITFAVRDIKIGGIEIKKDELIGLTEDKVVTSDVNQFHAVKGLFSKSLNEDSEILAVISGEDADNLITNRVTNWIELEYPDVEVEQHGGGQLICQYFFAVE